MIKNRILLLCLFGSLSLAAQKKQGGKNVSIRGHVTQTSDYCGGARPTEEILEQLKIPQALAKKIIYIKIGSVNSSKAKIVKKVITDEQGNFSVVLKSGMTYSFLEEWKGLPFKIPAPTEFIKWDVQCFKERYKKPDFILNVKSKSNAIVTINYYKPCFYKPYCGEYSGPLPP